MEIKDRGVEFLVYAALGIVSESIFNDNKKDYIGYYKKNYGIDNIAYDHYRILKCAQRAYLDLNRTLNMKNKDNDNSDFSKEVCKEIASNIYDNYSNDFDTLKTSIFGLYDDSKIIKRSVEVYLDETKNAVDEVPYEKAFHFGHFQKWVNMTLKYMNVLGMIHSDNESQLDIPLDSYIMKAMSLKGVVFPYKKEDKNGKKKGSYSEEKSVKWSRLNKDQYNDIVGQYKEKEHIKNNPLNWEHTAWIIMAEADKKIIEKSKLKDKIKDI